MRAPDHAEVLDLLIANVADSLVIDDIGDVRPESTLHDLDVDSMDEADIAFRMQKGVGLPCRLDREIFTDVQNLNDLAWKIHATLHQQVDAIR